MCRADWQSKLVRHKDGPHSDEFRRCSLGIRQMHLTDSLADGHNDPFPTDLRSQAKRQGHADLHPRRDEPPGAVHRVAIAGENGRVLALEIESFVFFIMSFRT